MKNPTKKNRIEGKIVLEEKAHRRKGLVLYIYIYVYNHQVPIFLFFLSSCTFTCMYVYVSERTVNQIHMEYQSNLFIFQVK